MQRGLCSDDEFDGNNAELLDCFYMSYIDEVGR